MLKKTVYYTNLDGESTSEDVYFHMSKVEIARLEMEHGEDGFSGHLRKVLESKDPKTIMAAFENFLAMSYGVRSEDGKRFIKEPALFDEFKQTEVYSQLFYDLVTNASSSADFIKGILPQDLVKNIDEKQVALLTAGEELPKELVLQYDSIPTQKSVDDMSVEELKLLPKEEFLRLVGDNPRKMTKNQLVVAMMHKTN